MEDYGLIPGQEQEQTDVEELEEMLPVGMGGLKALVEDKRLERELKYVYKEFRLANFTPEQERIFRELIAAAIQLHIYEEKYKKKGVNLHLEETIRMMLADAEAIAIASRSRKGFERRMLATQIQEIEQKEASEKKSKLGLFQLGGGRG
jgi:hypothetical protein